MNSDNWLGVTFYMLALILPLSALLTRRVPFRKMAGMAAIWAAIILVAMMIVGITRDGIGSGWARFTALLSSDEQRVSGGAVRLRMAPDGHFWANVTINGVPQRMLIDSGATTTSLGMDAAKASGLDVEQSRIPVPIQTANGMVMARTSSIRRLELGPIVATDLRADVAEEFGAMNVLGMNFLSRLGSWRVVNGWLILEPKRS
jgi:aspartyl protease family protein